MMAWQGAVGIIVFLALAWAMSESRWSVDKRRIAMGLVAQFTLALILLKIPQTKHVFLWIGQGVVELKKATEAGTQFVFGFVGGGTPPFDVTNPSGLFVFAFQALPMIMVISALSMLLFHWGILPAIIRGISWATQKVLRIGGALAACLAAKMFLGQTDAPLLVRPYMNTFSRNELFSVMTAGMATTSMTLFMLYCTLLEKVIPGNSVQHLLTASVINVPAALVIAELMVPARGVMTQGSIVMPYTFRNGMEAVSQGTNDGLKLMWGIAATLIVVLALVYLINSVLSSVTLALFGHGVTLQEILGYIFAPVMWLIGIPAQEMSLAGEIFSTKTAFNEILALMKLTELPSGSLSPTSTQILIYALCGFANFSSIAIQIAGLGEMAPDRKTDIIRLSAWALIGGTLAGCLSASLVSLLL